MGNIENVKQGNFLLLDYGNGIKETCKVIEVDRTNNKLQVLVLSKNSNNSEVEVVVNNLEGIRFKEEFLIKMGFYNDTSYQVYDLPVRGAYVKFYQGGHDLLVRKEDGNWCLVLENAHYGYELKPILYLHLFQNYVKMWWGLNTDTLFN